MSKKSDKFLEILENKKISWEFENVNVFIYDNIEGVTFENCRLHCVNFSGNTLKNCVFKNCLLHYCFFENCTFQNCTIDNFIIKSGRFEVKFENCQVISMTQVF